MVETVLIGLASLLLLYLGYLTSVFSVSLFLDAEQLRELYPKISAGMRTFLKKLEADPAVLIQVATFYKWLNVFFLTAFAFSANQALIREGFRSPIGFFFPLMFLGLCVGFLALEILPRRRSLQKLDKRFLRMAPVVRLAYSASKFYLRILRSIGSKPDSDLSDDVKEEIVERAIESLADQVGAGEKLVEEDERQMIENIFHLDNTVTKEIMTPRVNLVALPLDIKLPRLREIASEYGHSRYPVYRENIDKIAGVLLIKDIFTHPPKDPESFQASAYLKEPFFVSEEMPVDDLLSTFKSRKIHMAIVVDEHGGAAGIVTLEDVLEEIVGEIEDEHDDETAEFIDRGGGLYEVTGTYPMEDLAQRLSLDYQQEEFETVGGLLYDLVGSVPNEGQEIRWGKVTFVPIRLDGQRIDRILIRTNITS